jgi:hypothetical protein
VAVDGQRHEVDAVGPEGAAAQEAPGRQAEATPEPVLGEGLHRVVRAARIEAAPRDMARASRLVAPEELQRGPGGQIAPARGVHGATVWPDARRRARLTSEESWVAEWVVAAGSARSR